MRTKAGEAMLGRAPAQGRAHHPNSPLGVTEGQVHELSPWLCLHWGPDFPGRSSKPKETWVRRAFRVPWSLAGSIPICPGHQVPGELVLLPEILTA